QAIGHDDAGAGRTAEVADDEAVGVPRPGIDTHGPLHPVQVAVVVHPGVRGDVDGVVARAGLDGGDAAGPGRPDVDHVGPVARVDADVTVGPGAGHGHRVRLAAAVDEGVGPV